MKIDSLQQLNLELGGVLMLPEHALYSDLPTVKQALEYAGASAAFTKQLVLENFDLHLFVFLELGLFENWELLVYGWFT